MRRPFARRRRATPAPSLVLHGYCSYCRPDAPSFLSPPWIWMVRGERINERMQYLQWLVPGCSKVTGKASMLDEIINYVKSVEKKVEFLSIKYRRLPLPTCNHRPHAACPVSSTMLLSAMARLSIKPCLTMNGIAACNIFSQNLFSGSDAEFHSAENWLSLMVQNLRKLNKAYSPFSFRVA
ncbi:hypothetical protein BS78_04G000700 [Paspalum vaginatum]|nr:hypothetical protein BS78_04G000700 [Paspalum vaginatum]